MMIRLSSVKRLIGYTVPMPPRRGVKRNDTPNDRRGVRTRPAALPGRRKPAPPALIHHEIHPIF